MARKLPGKAEPYCGQAGTGSRNILLVCEDEAQRSLLRAYLQHVGFGVFSCADVRAAFRMLAEGRLVQLVLVDSFLLATSGDRLSESFAENYPDLPVFAISGRSAVDGTLREIKHQVWEPDSQPLLLPDPLGRIQALTGCEPQADSTDVDSAASSGLDNEVTLPAPNSLGSRCSTLRGGEELHTEEASYARKSLGARAVGWR